MCEEVCGPGNVPVACHLWWLSPPLSMCLGPSQVLAASILGAALAAMLYALPSHWGLFEVWGRPCLSCKEAW